MNYLRTPVPPTQFRFPEWLPCPREGLWHRASDGDRELSQPSPPPSAHIFQDTHVKASQNINRTDAHIPLRLQCGKAKEHQLYPRGRCEVTVPTVKETYSDEETKTLPGRSQV